MSNAGSGKLIPSSLMHCAKFRTPSSKVVSSSTMVVSVVESIVTTPCDSSPPIVHAVKTATKTSSFTFLPLLLAEFWKLL